MTLPASRTKKDITLRVAPTVVGGPYPIPHDPGDDRGPVDMWRCKGRPPLREDHAPTGLRQISPADQPERDQGRDALDPQVAE